MSETLMTGDTAFVMFLLEFVEQNCSSEIQSSFKKIFFGEKFTDSIKRRKINNDMKNIKQLNEMIEKQSALFWETVSSPKNIAIPRKIISVKVIIHHSC
jgi:tripartite-type tricarboxylate transporter receptor subunit TctC